MRDPALARPDPDGLRVRRVDRDRADRLDRHLVEDRAGRSCRRPIDFQTPPLAAPTKKVVFPPSLRASRAEIRPLIVAEPMFRAPRPERTPASRTGAPAAAGRGAAFAASTFAFGPGRIARATAVPAAGKRKSAGSNSTFASAVSIVSVRHARPVRRARLDREREEDAGDRPVAPEVGLLELLGPADEPLAGLPDRQEEVGVEVEGHDVAVLERDAELVGRRAVHVLGPEVLDGVPLLPPPDERPLEVGFLGAGARLVGRGPVGIAAALEGLDAPGVLPVPGVHGGQPLQRDLVAEKPGALDRPGKGHVDREVARRRRGPFR